MQKGHAYILKLSQGHTIVVEGVAAEGQKSILGLGRQKNLYVGWHNILGVRWQFSFRVGVAKCVWMSGETCLGVVWQNLLEWMAKFGGGAQMFGVEWEKTLGDGVENFWGG